MKKISWILMMLCCTCFVGCKDDNKDGPSLEGDSFTLMNGSIVVDKNLNIEISNVSEKDRFPKGYSTEAEFSGNRSKSGLKALADNESTTNDLRGKDYRFRLIKEVGTLITEDNVKSQATHVKIEKIGDNQYYAFVTYNEQKDGYHGGIVVYHVTVTGSNLEELTTEVTVRDALKMSLGELSAVDYYDNKLYVTGATIDKNLGYATKDGGNRAVYMVFELNADKTFKNAMPFVKMLTSFQGTSIRVANGRAYITTGDGTEGTQGGLYIFDTADNSEVKFISGKDHARSVDVDNTNIYLMQAEPARITKYDFDGNGEEIYKVADEALQKDAKSEILSWNNYLFVAENESGMRMLNKSSSPVVNDFLAAPYTDKELVDKGEAYVKSFYVTNSIAMNSDKKKDSYGKDVSSNLLLLANGEKGIYWYDIMTVEGKDRIVLCNDNRTLLGTGSANFVASTGNIVFVADGLGGLKILYIGFDNGDPPPPVGPACDNFMSYLFKVGDVTSLLPESYSVFRDEAHGIVKKLFADPVDVIKYIEVEQETELYISYIGEWANWRNSLGYFVIPASVPQNDVDELAYYNSKKNDIFTLDGSTYVLNDAYVIFKNISDVNEGGPLTPSSLYQIGTTTFKAGDRMVLFIVPDGWSSQNSRVEVSLNEGSWNQAFSTHRGINIGTKISYPDMYNHFKGIQHNAFYSADCSSIVIFFEDNHNSGGDVDYDDVVFSVTDNKDKVEISKIKPPKWSIVEESGNPELKLTSELKK